MTTQTEALKLALEALETSARNWPSDSIIEAISAIKEALAQPEQERCVGCEACIDTACGRDECPKGWPKAAQPEQEPVAWMSEHRFDELRKGFTVMTTLTKQRAFEDDVALYTTPPQRKPLTDDNIWDSKEIMAANGTHMQLPMSELIAVVHAVEAAHGIKE